MPAAFTLVTPDAQLFQRLLPVARAIFTETFAARCDATPFEEFCDAVYAPDGAMSAEFDAPGVQWRVAVSGDEPIGYAKLTPLRAPAPVPSPDAVELQQLYVLPSWHGRGVAEALMAWSLAQARARAASEIYLTVFDHNERAKRFYARHGFEEVGRCTFQLGSRIDDDRIWRRSL
jgi:GNAT superfamily N-acetyltransferase